MVFTHLHGTIDPALNPKLHLSLCVSLCFRICVVCCVCHQSVCVSDLRHCPPVWAEQHPGLHCHLLPDRLPVSDGLQGTEHSH